MRPHVRRAPLAAVLVFLATFASIHVLGQAGAGTFSPLVNERGDIAFPADFPEGFMHIGTVAVAGNGGVLETHASYARPSDVAYYRANGVFPDGAVLVKDVQAAIGSSHSTGHAFWAAGRKTWFLMIKDRVGRYPQNPLWGDGWGWAQYDSKDRPQQIATNYKTDCLQCHVPAKATDWVYVYAYQGLGERVRRFTPPAARAANANVATVGGQSGASPTATLVRGKAAFEDTCANCHTVKAGENNTGPSLFGVVGRKAGSEATYAYSPALRESAVVWSRETLAMWLADPKGFITGNRMGRFFSGVDSLDTREALAQYLESVR